MRIRVICCVILGIAGLLSSNIEEVLAAEDAGRRNNLFGQVVTPTRPSNPDDSFSRMFPGLPPFAPPTKEARERAQKLGDREKGVINAQDLLVDPVQSIVNPAVHSPYNPDNPNMTAGVTYFGQFIDHDLTLAL